MKLHYVNVFILLIFSLICSILAMVCNKENCGDKKDRSDAFDGSGAMLGISLVWMLIIGAYVYSGSSKFFGLFGYFLSIVIAIISASFALQCLTSCDKISDNLKTAIQGVAGFTIPFSVIVGGIGFYYYMKGEGAGGITKALSKFKAFENINKYRSEASSSWDKL